MELLLGYLEKRRQNPSLFLNLEAGFSPVLGSFYKDKIHWQRELERSPLTSYCTKSLRGKEDGNTGSALLSRSPILPPGLTDHHRSQGQLHFEAHEDKLNSHNNAVLHARPGTASSTNYILCFNFCKLPVPVSIFFLRKRTKCHN